MLLVGLTGGIGCGKSTVAKILSKSGVTIIDADAIARQVVQPDRKEYLQLRAEFGDEYFDDEQGGVLKREMLGSLIFHNAEKRRKLNAIVHPAVRRELFTQVIRNAITLKNFIVLDIPLLFESGYERFLSKIIVVSCNLDVQLQRVVSRDGLTEGNALSRINAQMPTSEKVRRATYVIDNNGSLESTRQQVQAILSQLRSSYQPWLIRGALLSILFLVTLLVFRQIVQ